jgi:EAL domain-containing protein (putative c-di-GMP-specific phosphodiesterase class I)
VRLRAAVNISILDVMTDDFDTQVRAALDHYGIDPEQLMIEISERSTTDPPSSDNAGITGVRCIPASWSNRWIVDKITRDRP